MHKDLKKVLKAAAKQGFDHYLTARGHVVVQRNGRRITTFSGTASDQRSMANGISAMKRAGFQWPPRR